MPTPFFQILPNPSPPNSLLPPTPTPTAHSVVLFLWLNGWSRHIWCAILLNDIMDVHMSNLGTLMHILWVHTEFTELTCNVAFCWYSNLIRHTHTHTHTHTHSTAQHSTAQHSTAQHSTAHSGPIEWHTHIKIYLHQMLCAHSSYLYYIEWIIHWYQKLMSFLFKNYSLVTAISVD